MSVCFYLPKMMWSVPALIRLQNNFHKHTTTTTSCTQIPESHSFQQWHNFLYPGNSKVLHIKPLKTLEVLTLLLSVRSTPTLDYYSQRNPVVTISKADGKKR